MIIIKEGGLFGKGRKHYINKKWESNHDFTLFYENILKLLNDLAIHPSPSSHTPLDPQICNHLADSIELQAKTLVVVINLINDLLPGYLSQLNYENTIDYKSMEQQSNHDLSIEQIKKNMKSIFELPELPSSLSFVDNHPEILNQVYDQILNDMAISRSIGFYFQGIKHLFNSTVKGNVPLNISPEEQGMLLPLLIKSIQYDPKHILLEYLFMPFCAD
ncbi:hypothetical protein [Litchfieldia salsa]|uniref:Uncharacterized protein n=1 Tax=Litchfieldia salsa TaxID=930152 RepID=A0A1H0PJ48_9BACI|nr:hypothetical protein [Litchfieldia salsa]SDP05132.1 hypothetical protein SAMN05216565_101343 [Litchfieldia salsa]